MKIFPRLCLIATCLFVCQALCGAAATRPRYVLTDLGTAPGATWSGSVAINNRGQVAIQIESKDGPRSSVWLPDKPNGTTGKYQDLGLIPYEEPALDHTPETIVNDINDKGIMVGVSGSGFHYRGADYSDAFMMKIGKQLSRAYILGPEVLAVPKAINNRGVIVGALEDASTSHAMIWSANGRARSLGKLHKGDQACSALDVNDRGAIVGYSDGYAWLLTGNRMRDLGRGCANGISNRNIIAGESGGRACMWVGAKRRALDRTKYQPGVSVGEWLSYMRSAALAINDSGLVVGQVAARAKSKAGSHAHYESRAAMWVDGRITMLTDVDGIPPRWTLISAQSVNNKGQIVGVGQIAGIEPGRRAFLLTPVH